MYFTITINLRTLLILALAYVSSASSPSTPNDYSPTPARSGPAAIVDIQQTLNQYALSVDSKNYVILADIFTPDARADFLVFPVVHGLPAIVAVLSKALEGLISQHSLTTQVITLESETDASAITYLQGNFFGQGNLTGQVLNNYGKYIDDLTFVQNVGWRVRNRTLVNFVSLIGRIACFLASSSLVFATQVISLVGR